MIAGIIIYHSSSAFLYSGLENMIKTSFSSPQIKYKLSKKQSLAILDPYVSRDVVDLGSKGCKLVQDILHVLTVFVEYFLRPVVGVTLDRNGGKVTRQ